MQDAKDTLEQMLMQQSEAFIGAVDQAGFPCIKAMLAPRKWEGLTVFYFTTNTSSAHVAQYQAQPKASVYFCDRRNFKGILLQGTMEVLEDAASKELIWQAGDDLYYPLGVTDPDYCVLRFTANSGRYYSDFHSENFSV